MINKNILILSANTGEGHNSAAGAICEAMEERGCSCRIEDGLSFLPAWINAAVCRGHIFLYRRMPTLFGMGYRLCEILSMHRPFQKRLKTLHRISKGQRRLLQLIKEGRFDAVICSHVFPARMISRLRISGMLSLPCYFLATDYTCSPGVNQLDMDAWFIPHEKLIPAFAAQGIPANKIIAAGIPVQKEFVQKGGRSALRRKLGLPEDRRIIVLSCGSMGAGRMEKLVPAILENLPENVLLTVICSKNRKLEQKLKTTIPNSQLLVLGFVDSLADYMEAADLYITKPGGLSTTEAMHKGVPVLLFNAVPGLETRNLQFLTGIGCVEAAETCDLPKRICEILHDETLSSTLIKYCASSFCGDAAGRICDVIFTKKELSD